jgi:anti-sigma factor RsiW
MSFDDKTTAQERFELLSAYIDNEVTSTERSQVEQWLKDDLSYRTQYQQLLKVKRLLLDLPVPSCMPTELLVSKVIAKINKRSQRKLAISGAIVALVIAIFGSVANNYRLKLADDTNNEEQLILAMEEPIIPMPESLRR